MTPMQLPLPETRYARSGNVSIAYQVMGDGPIDLLMVPGLLSHVEFFHELPGYTDFLRRLAAAFNVRFERLKTSDGWLLRAAKDQP